jgi:hypothetical protein
MAEHARLSPSGAEKWATCPGSMALEALEPDSSNDYSDEGTAAHFLAALCLEQGKNAADFRTQSIAIFNGKADWKFCAHKYPGVKMGNVFTIDDEMAGHVQTYLDKVREYATGKMLMVEQRMSISHLTGEEDAAGTGDTVILDIEGSEIIVADLKYGMREVDGDNNKQLKIYALAALKEFEMYGDFQTVRTVIIQPRIGHYPEWSCTIDELQAFGMEVRAAADEAQKAKALYDQGCEITAFLNPGDHCRNNYCKARATCPALSKFVTDSIGEDFENMDAKNYTQAIGSDMVRALTPEQLGEKMDAIALIEDWCKAVRAKVEAELFAGRAVPGYKLVQGKKGNRQWTSKEEAEAMLKGFKLKVGEMYDLKLISPTSAEKLAKAAVIGPRQWPKLSAYITQAEGSPSVAPESDKRPALVVTPVADAFEDLTQEPEFSDMI